MSGPIMLNEAIEEFLRYRKSAGFSANTIRLNASGLSMLLAQTGNIQMKHLEARHGETFQAYLMGKGYAANTVNSHLTTLAAFTKWCRQRRYLGAGSDPTATTRQVRTVPEPRQRVEAKDFELLLELAPNPHERIVTALGLYLFLRASEINRLRVGFVHLDRGEIEVIVTKTKQLDVMPISSELDAELRRWLEFYTTDIRRPLHDDMYLVPRRRRRPMANDGTGKGGGYPVYRDHDNCDPYQPMVTPHRYVQAVLNRYGIETKGKREGVHTLRRSGARALFDQLVQGGSYDGVLRTVAAMLHHKSTTMTERYLGLDVDVKKRNDLLRGTKMFRSPSDIIDASPNIHEMTGVVSLGNSYPQDRGLRRLP